MKSFDIESIGKKMPYTTPSEAFFESLSEDTLARIRANEQSQKRRSLLRRITISIPAVAAAAAIIVNITLHSSGANNNLNDFEANLDRYVEALSDDELNSLLYEIEAESEFYTNL